MHAGIVWWDLSASGQTIESMREYLRKLSRSLRSPRCGLRFKGWISDLDASGGERSTGRTGIDDQSHFSEPIREAAVIADCRRVPRLAARVCGPAGRSST